MPNYIQIQNQIDPKDHIIIIENNQFVILMFSKTDFKQLKSIELLRANGIYILYNNNKLYVGQNSSEKGIITRLNKHYARKLWWENGIIFIPKQIFTKAHYDYIEKTFIKRFRQYKIELDNVTDGNTSPITVEEFNQAEMFISNVTTVLDKLFGKNIFMLTKDNYTKYLENLVNQLLDDTLEKN